MYLTASSSPGTVTEELVVQNLQRMMEQQLEQDGEEVPDWSEMRSRARAFYNENPDRMLELAPLGVKLVKAEERFEGMTPEGLAEELVLVTFDAWLTAEYEVAVSD